MNDKTKMTEVNEQDAQAVENAEVGTLQLHREVIKDKFGKTLKDRNGNDLYNYFVLCKLNGRDVKIDFSAKDNGGYEVLGDIFSFAPTAVLYIHDETSTDNNGRKRTYRVYEAQNTDSNGILWSYPIKPSRPSDGAQINTLLLYIAKGIIAA